MSDGVNGYIVEYQTLRDEIMYDIKLYNSLTTLTLTAVVAFLGYLISNNIENSILYFLPIPIIIAISVRTLYYRRKIAEISAYIIVFLESRISELNWETRNNKFEHEVTINELPVKRFKKIINSKFMKFWHETLNRARYTEFLILIVMCFILYIYSIITHSCSDINLSCGNYVTIFVFVVSIFLEVIITIDMNRTSTYRKQCIDEWEHKI